MKRNLSENLSSYNRNKHHSNIIFTVLMTVISLNTQAGSAGKELFNQNCSVCHANDGSGAMPGIADLTTSKMWPAMTDKQLSIVLQKGIQKPGALINMPPNGGNPKLTDKDLLSIIHYMRKNFSH